MHLPATKYPTTQRIVSGTVNVYPDDVILYCDTTTAPVVINLLDIPLNNFSVQYRLTVVDLSNNASTNNITINAGLNELITPNVQQTINGQNSLVLNVNKAEALIEISAGLSNNTQNKFSYIATISYSSAFPTPTGFIEVTYLELLNLVNTNAIIPNGDYLLLDANYGNAPIIPTKVYLKGMTTNEVTSSGQGIFFNADYQTVGDYSGITGFGAQLGLWDSTLTPVLNDVVIWDNFHFKNLTGANGVTNPVTDTTNWEKLALSTTNGYIQEINEVGYWIQQNIITSRLDELLNYVEVGGTSFNLFKWGSERVVFNKVIGESSIEICNTDIKGDFSTNTFQDKCTIRLYDVNKMGEIYSMKVNTFVSTIVYSVKLYNFIENHIIASELEINISGGIAELNQNFISTTNIEITDLLNNFERNTINNSEIVITEQNGLFRGNTLTGIQATIGTNKDFTNNTCNQGILTIPINENIISVNNSFDSTLTITNTDNGEFRDNTLNVSTLEITSNKGTITNNKFDNVNFNISTENLGTIDSNQFLDKTDFVIQTNGLSGIISNNVFSGIEDVVKFGNNSRFIKNRFINVLELEIEGNENDITQNEALNIEIFRISSTNYNSIRFNSISFDSSFFITGTTTDTGSIFANTVTQNSTLRVTNNNGQIFSNTISSSSKIQITTNNVGASLSYNQLSNDSTLEVTTNSGKIGELANDNGNILENNSIVTLTTIGILGVFTLNKISGSVVNVTTNLGTIKSNSITLSSSLDITTNSANGYVSNNTVINNSIFTIDSNDGKIGENDGMLKYANTIQDASVVNLSTITTKGIFGRVQLSYSRVIIVSLDSDFTFNSFLNSDSTFSNCEKIVSFNNTESSNLNITDISGSIQHCNFLNSTVTIENCDNMFEDISTNKTIIEIIDMGGFQMNNINFSQTTFIFPVLAQDYTDKLCSLLYSNIQEELDTDDALIYDAGTKALTVPTNIANIAGIVKLLNSSGKEIKIITDNIGEREITYINDSGTTDFTSETIATATNNEIISDLGTHTFPITYRAEGYDSINIKRQGIYNVVKSYNIFT